MRVLAAVALTLALIAGPGQAQTPKVVVEAQAFMAAYGKDLARGDRAAVAARYDRTGAFFLVGGQRAFEPHDQIVRNYARDWKPPVSFEWRNLHFDAVGDDAVVVNGEFLWGQPDGPKTYTYTGFLRRQDGALKIRLEDETPAVSSPRVP
jgi:hypothetical protein